MYYPRHHSVSDRSYPLPTVSAAITQGASAPPPRGWQPTLAAFVGKGSRSGRVRAIGMLIAALGSLYMVIAPGAASAQGIATGGTQELDGSIDFTGNTVSYNNPNHDTATPTVAPYDWNSLFTAAGGGGSITTTAASCQVGSCPGLINDVGLPYNGDLFTQGSKDVLDVSRWTCTQQANPPKDELVNTYGAAWTAQTGSGVSLTAGDTLLYLGAERPNTNGDANAGFWLFKSQVICNPTTGQFSTSPTGTVAATHSNGDLFIVGSFIGGGSNAVLTASTWSCSTAPGSDACTSTSGSLVPLETGNLNCPAIPAATANNFCEVVNQQVTTTVANGKTTTTTSNWNVNTPWTNIDTGSGGIPGPGFLEMGIDLSSLFGSPGKPAPCFASFLADTRSSGSSTQASTKDFINASFPTCGSAGVHKYIDTNLNGHYDGPNSTDLNGAGWPVSVTDPFGNVICSGTTDASGNLNCGAGQRGLSNLPAGTYTVSETQLAGFYNTDPGTGSTCSDAAANSATPPDSSDVNEAKSVQCTFQVANGASAVAQIGNQCTVAQTFAVDNLPAGTTGAFATFTVTSGFDRGASGTVALSAGTGGVYSGTSTFPFIQNDVLNWSFYINNDPTHSVGGASGVTSTYVYSSTAGTAACAHTSHGAFSPATIEGFKFKDVTGTGFATDGSVPPGDNPLANVSFSLLSGTTVVKTASSVTGTGAFTFTGVDPGTYTISETVPTGWHQTGPTNPSTYTVTVHLGDGTVTTDTSGKTLNFLDTPSYDFSAAFQSLAVLPGTTTPATHGAISCTPAPSGETGSGTGSYGSGTIFGASATYSCSIVVTDP